MLGWKTLVNRLVAMLAGFFGFGGISIESNKIAKVLVMIFLVILVVSLMQDQGLIQLYR